MRHIDSMGLKEWLDRGDRPVLLDIREPWEYELSQLDNSRNIPMSVITEKVKELEQTAETLVTCHNGVRSLQVAEYLESLGFTDTVNLEGGLDAWARIIDPDMPQY